MQHTIQYAWTIYANIPEKEHENKLKWSEGKKARKRMYGQNGRLLERNSYEKTITSKEVANFIDLFLSFETLFEITK